MKTLFCALLFLGLALHASADTDISGKWSGSFNLTNANGETKDATAYFVLKQTGSEITGTVGPSEDEQYQIGKGKIDGNKITIEVDHEGHNLKLALVLAADRITGQANMSGEGQNMTAKIDVTRVK